MQRDPIATPTSLTASQLSATAAHTANNASALLNAAMDVLAGCEETPALVRGQSVLAVVAARVHTLAGALSLLAIEPKHVALAASLAPRPVHGSSLDLLMEDWLREPQIELLGGPSLHEARLLIDGSTMRALLVCMVDCARRRLPEGRRAQICWRCTGTPGPADPVWEFVVAFGPDATAAGPAGLADHALALAAAQLGPLGVTLALDQEDRLGLQLRSAPVPVGVHA